MLHALAGNVPGDREVFGLAGNLVDLVDVDDAYLGAVDIEISGRYELEQDVLDVFANIARFGERRGIGNGKRHAQRSRERLREERLARAGRTEQEDVALSELDVVVARRVEAYALVVVVHRHRKRLLRRLLAHDVIGKLRVELMGRRKVGKDFRLGWDMLVRDALHGIGIVRIPPQQASPIV